MDEHIVTTLLWNCVLRSSLASKDHHILRQNGSDKCVVMMGTG
jgi:hypothetical protein